MSQATELIALQMANAANALNIWGNIIINVKSYGAKGDGTTDDTAAIQAAITYAISIGKREVTFPSGSYKYGALFNTSGIVFIGDGVVLTGITTLNLTSTADIQLEKANQTDLDSVNSSIILLQNNKLDKTGTVTVAQITKNGGLIDQTYLTPELIAQIAGTAAINAVPTDGSVTPDKTTVMKSVVNLFNPAGVTVGIVNSGNGTIIFNASYYASGYLPVVFGKTYKATPCADYAFYNSSNVFVSGVEHPLAPASITPPSGAAYVRITIQGIDLATSMVVRDALPSIYLPFGSYTIEITDSKFRDAIVKTVGVTSKWSGKIWDAMGDSITEHNARTTKNYQDYIADRIGCSVNNYGISGTGWRTPSTVGGTDAFYQRIGSLASNADLITVFGGTNDWAEVGIPFNMGTFGDTVPATSFYGALDYTIKALINKYPTKTIAVFTPIPRGPNPWALNNGVTLEQVADAIIKVSTHYCVPVLDLYRLANVYAWNTDYNTYALPDGLHPNDNGHVILADKILAFLNTL